MNKLTAIFCITIYTFLMFIGSTALINATNKPQDLKKYENVPYNEDLYVNLQVLENRDSIKENTDHESSQYDSYFVVTKKNVGDEVTNLYAYICAESNGKYHYNQTSYGSSIKATYTTYTYYRNTTISLLNSSNKYAYKEYETEDEKTKLDDATPDTLYVRLSYDIKKVGSTETVSKELCYKFKYDDVSKGEKLAKNSKLEAWTTTSGFLTTEESPFKIKLAYSKDYTDNNEVSLDMYRVVSFDVKDDIVGENTVESMKMDIYGEITNTDLIDKGFDKYVKLFSYNGSFNLEKPNEAIDVSRQTYLANEYNVEKVYVSVEMKLSNGKTYKNVFYTTVANLPQA